MVPCCAVVPRNSCSGKNPLVIRAPVIGVLAVHNATYTKHPFYTSGAFGVRLWLRAASRAKSFFTNQFGRKWLLWIVAVREPAAAAGLWRRRGQAGQMRAEQRRQRGFEKCCRAASWTVMTIIANVSRYET